MRYPFSRKQIPRREWFLTLIKIKNQRDRGGYWINLVLSIVNPQTLFNTAILISLKLTQVGISFSLWLILILLAFSGVLIEIVKWRIGRKDYKKWKLWELEQEWITKDKVAAPFNVDLMDTLKGICEELKIPHHFRALDRAEDKEEK